MWHFLKYPLRAGMPVAQLLNRFLLRRIFMLNVTGYGRF